MTTIAIIAARGGSKGIPRKNLTPICGKPLIYWTIVQCLNTTSIDKVYVTSDDYAILSYSTSLGSTPIERPSHHSSDTATSEDAWIHALDFITSQENLHPSLLVLPQATSPIRHSVDFDKAIYYFRKNNLDSLLSVCKTEDRFVWGYDIERRCVSLNYDFNSRSMRQSLPHTYLENGSFYITTPIGLISSRNRLSGSIGFYEMELYKQFQIDNPSDIPLVEAMLHSFILSSDEFPG
jgi:N-acylneuraminate cytidylyltransferase